MLGRHTLDLCDHGTAAMLLRNKHSGQAPARFVRSCPRRIAMRTRSGCPLGSSWSPATAGGRISKPFQGRTATGCGIVRCTVMWGQLLWQRVVASDLWPHRRAACGWCRCVRKSLQLEWRGCNLKSTHSLLCFRGRSPRRLARTIFSGVHAPHDRHCAGLGVAFSAAVLNTGWLGGWVSGWLGEWMWAGGRMSVWEGGWVGRRVGG